MLVRIAWHSVPLLPLLSENSHVLAPIQTQIRASFTIQTRQTLSSALLLLALHGVHGPAGQRASVMAARVSKITAIERLFSTRIMSPVALRGAFL